ncbi:MAG: DUF1573 domain-containing protein, partial [Lentisphaeria bacterium]|nr:DUF1573 domain-containing protein [Lentisphaeria bacterium]
MRNCALFVCSRKHASGRSGFPIGVAMLFAVCLGAGAGEPRLACEERVHDFGKQVNTSVVSHTFILENRGTDPLVIKSIRKGCSCTTTRIRAKTIPPGESVDLGVSVDLKGRFGLQSQAVYLYTNDPASQVVRLSMKGMAERVSKEKNKAAATPRDTAMQSVEIPGRQKGKVWRQPLALGRIKPDAQSARQISVPDGLRILEVTSDHASVRCEIDVRQPQRIHVRLEPPLPAGILKATIHISIDHPTAPEILVPVT